MGILPDWEWYRFLCRNYDEFFKVGNHKDECVASLLRKSSTAFNLQASCMGLKFDLLRLDNGSMRCSISCNHVGNQVAKVKLP
jgi:hypothetical protein